MKPTNTFLAVFAALIWIAMPACSSGSDTPDAPTKTPQTQTKNATITWYGYDEGMAMGKQSGKKILLHFYADWCTYCKKMNREVFSKGDSADYINQNFVPIRVNSDKEKQLAASYRVRGLPTTWFLDQNGERIMSLPGYIPKKMFMVYLKFIQTESYRNMSFSAFMGVE